MLYNFYTYIFDFVLYLWFCIIFLILYCTFDFVSYFSCLADCVWR